MSINRKKEAKKDNIRKRGVKSDKNKKQEKNGNVYSSNNII